ncbi:hypothetical protein AURDEDRAFT_140679 [Auricularia subglabra TFB-10046 SS5]|uniref:Uncharacterized protein n=1 Tax=Auricularia subglabra (strain TFB-10046 / SS5) TaxID=717982 RepID=J0CR50_AURST|nr:hypothetical protein AURDEDRAFT_140679 [Auricularia subglabra TFB-10046 SS5]
MTLAPRPRSLLAFRQRRLGAALGALDATHAARYAEERAARQADPAHFARIRLPEAECVRLLRRMRELETNTQHGDSEPLEDPSATIQYADASALRAPSTVIAAGVHCAGVASIVRRSAPPPAGRPAGRHARVA